MGTKGGVAKHEGAWTKSRPPRKREWKFWANKVIGHEVQIMDITHLSASNLINSCQLLTACLFGAWDGKQKTGILAMV